MYISPMMENADVLHYYADTMQPEIARRFEALVEAESDLEDAQEAAEKTEFALESLQDAAADKAQDLEYILSDELPAVLDGKTKAERAEALRIVVDGFKKTIEQLRGAIAQSVEDAK